MSPHQRPTLRDVASKAGVSLMTASRVLRNHPNVSAPTRLAVQQAARLLNYRPNPLVSALMTYRRSSRGHPAEAEVIALITAFPTRDGWQDAPINLEFRGGAAEACARHGYRLEEFWLREPGMNAKRLSQVLYNRRISGLLMAPLPNANGHVRMDWDKFATVALGYSLAWPPLHRAVNHQFRAMQLALRRLRKGGYRRPGLALKASYDRRVEHQWVGSFLVEQQRLGGGALPMHVPPDKDWSAPNFQAWVKQSQPDVIITQHEEVLPWLTKMGLRVPADIGVIHLNCPRKNPRWAGIVQNAPAVGALAVDHLVAMLQRNERGIPALPHYLLVEGSWRKGATVRNEKFRQAEGDGLAP